MFEGLKSPFRALGLLRRNPRLLLVLMLAPWTINMTLFFGGWSLLWVWLSDKVDSYLASLVGGWWGTLLTGLGNLVAVVAAGGLAFLITVIGAAVVAAPFHDRLSATVEKTLHPDRPNAGARMGLVGAFREGAKTALVLLMIEISLLPLYLVPGPGHLLFIMLSGFVLTLGLLDVPLARHELTLQQKRGFVRRRWWPIWGLSLVVIGVSIIPLVNFVAIPVVVIAATIIVAESSAEAMALDGPSEPVG